MSLALAPMAWAQSGSKGISLFNADGTVNRPLANVIFLYGRARGFHDIVAQRRCDGVNPATIDTVNQRLETARAALATKYGDKLFPADRPLKAERDGPCDGMTVASYANHVAEVEQALNAMPN